MTERSSIFRVEDAGISRKRFLEVGAGSAAALSLGGLLAGCGNNNEGDGDTEPKQAEPRRGGHLKVVIGDAVSSDNQDPATAFTVFSTAYSGMVFDALVELDDQWRTSPMLAEEWEVSDDLRTYTFVLRDGVTFHNGKPLTADDVVFSYQRIFDPDLGAAGLGIFQAVLDAKGVTKVDKKTVRMELTAPDANFLIKAGGPYAKIVPDGTTDFSKGSHGTGPYTLKSFKGGQGMEVERNPDYWVSELPYLDSVSAVVITDPSTRAQAVLTGDADLGDPPTFPVLAQFEQSSEVGLIESDFGPAFVFGIDGSSPPFDNPDVRRAAKMAVDRDKFVSLVARGYATASPDSPVNPNEPYYPEGIEAPEYDPEQAKALLEKAGGAKATIWTTSGLRALGDGAALLEEQWRAAGFDATVENVSFDDLLGRHFLQDPVVANYWLRLHYSVALPAMCTSDGPFNEARIADPQLDKLIGDLQSTPLEDGGQDILREVLQRYEDVTAPIWPFHMKEVWVKKNRVNNALIRPTEIISLKTAFVA